MTGRGKGRVVRGQGDDAQAANSEPEASAAGWPDSLNPFASPFAEHEDLREVQWRSVERWKHTRAWLILLALGFSPYFIVLTVVQVVDLTGDMQRFEQLGWLSFVLLTAVSTLPVIVTVALAFRREHKQREACSRTGAAVRKTRVAISAQRRTNTHAKTTAVRKVRSSG